MWPGLEGAARNPGASFTSFRPAPATPPSWETLVCRSAESKPARELARKVRLSFRRTLGDQTHAVARLHIFVGIERLRKIFHPKSGWEKAFGKSESAICR